MEVLIIIFLEIYFVLYCKNVIGQDFVFDIFDGFRCIFYVDWMVSGCLYKFIEEWLMQEIGLFVVNMYMEIFVIGIFMMMVYYKVKEIIKVYVGARLKDVLIFFNFGMIGVVNKFQCIFGLKVYEKFCDWVEVLEEEWVIIFCIYMEYYFNQIFWLEMLVDVEVIRFMLEGLVDLEYLKMLLQQY